MSYTGNGALCAASTNVDGWSGNSSNRMAGSGARLQNLHWSLLLFDRHVVCGFMHALWQVANARDMCVWCICGINANVQCELCGMLFVVCD